MSQLENTEDMMSQLNASFGSTTSTSQNDTALYPPHPTHVRRKTQSEDLSILAHAQDQLQSHLAAAAPLQSSDSTWQSHAHPQPPYLYPPHQTHRSQHAHPHPYQQPRPRSSHQFSSTKHPDLRAPVTVLPLRWWETGVLVSNSESEEEDIRPSIEPLEPDAMSVVQSIEAEPSVSPGTVGALMREVDGAQEVKMEGASGDEARLWDGPQTWNGYVKHKESWVRRAGLKREREVHERSGAAKRGRT